MCLCSARKTPLRGSPRYAPGTLSVCLLFRVNNYLKASPAKDLFCEQLPDDSGEINSPSSATLFSQLKTDISHLCIFPFIPEWKRKYTTRSNICFQLPSRRSAFHPQDEYSTFAKQWWLLRIVVSVFHSQSLCAYHSTNYSICVMNPMWVPVKYTFTHTLRIQNSRFESFRLGCKTR